jgi:glycosyltransferase involved in cell wall biosynthesis
MLLKKKKILWFTWKDLKNPQAGGAEVVNQEIAKRLVNDGHQVIFIVAGFPGSKKKEIIDGYKIIRVGNRWSVYFWAYKYYKKHLKNWPDLIIEEINTFPFFSQLYARNKTRVLIVYQLCRQIWFYQILFPLSLIGYLFEPLYLRLLRKNRVITISASTKNDLLRYGYKKRNIKIMTPGIEINPVKDLKRIKKYDNFTLLSLGAIRKMKRPDHQIKAFELAKQKISQLKLKIAGAGFGRYYQQIMKLIANSPCRKDIEYLGKISGDDKIELMQKCHLILVTSVKEGWGLIVTEANSQGTPAVVYDVDGLRDSVQNNKTGLIAKKNAPNYLARRIVELAEDKKKYARLRAAAWKWSKSINFDNCYKKFLEVINEK